ncbi:MAG: alpha-glucan family phosphorylase, partial [Chloroflexota bacterium]
TPIAHITNGIHPLSWISGHDMAPLFVRYLGGRWLEDPTDQTLWQGVDRIPNEELWRTHERRRERLVAFARNRIRAQLERRGALPSEITLASEALDPEALTIAFARRFATYTRPTLLLSDPQRLARILSNEERPVQIVFAGKAHPHDDPGKELIRQLFHFSRREEVQRRVVFIEDYDIEVARYLVQGADVWLNTPTRPLEACGTSGMKAAANGVLNVSVLDGWWPEACHPDAGWTIGNGEEYSTPDLRDDVESKEIYDLLEKEVIPLFYERGTERLPRGWVRRMRDSMRVVAPVFNSHRMLREYWERFYVPATNSYHRLAANDIAGARALAQWEADIRREWPGIQVISVQADMPAEMGVGCQFQVRAEVCLSGLTAQDVAAELYYGPLDAELSISNGVAKSMECIERNGGNSHRFECTVPCQTSGLHGYALRIVPRHKDLPATYLPGLVLWAT